jgi:hypothetical protein
MLILCEYLAWFPLNIDRYTVGLYYEYRMSLFVNLLAPKAIFSTQLATTLRASM